MNLNKINDRGNLIIPEVPMMFFLDLTQKCNLKCWFCYKDSENHHEDANLDDIIHILDIMSGAGCNEVMYLGGEPTVYPYFFDVLDYAGKLGMIQSFISNGQAIDDSFAKKLRKFPELEAGISIHSSVRRIQDNASGSQRSFQNILRAINALNRNGIKWYSQTSLLKSNYRGLKELYDFLKEEGPPLRMDLSRMTGTGRHSVNDEFLTEYEYIEVFAQINELDTNVLPIRIESFPRCWLKKIASAMNFDLAKLKKAVRPCYAWVAQMSIDIYGNVRLCPTGGISAGNILRDGFSRIWKGNIIKNFQKFEWQNPECVSCDDFAFCGGGCKMTCDFLSPTPDCYTINGLLY